jgi:hypothetical protein
MLYRSTDCRCRRGAPVVNLSHSASFHSGEKIAPSKPGIKHLDWKTVDGVHQLGNLSIQWENSGLSPARRVRLKAQLETLEISETGVEFGKWVALSRESKLGHVDIASRGKATNAHSNGDDTWLSPEQTERFIKSDIAIVIFSMARYVDVFGEEHLTTSCSQAHYFEETSSQKSSIRFSVYPHHNYED